MLGRESRKERLERLAKLREQFKELDEHALFKSTPLIEAIADGNHDEVRRLLDSGADVNEPGSGFTKYTPLIVAVQFAGLVAEARTRGLPMPSELLDFKSQLTDRAKSLFPDPGVKPAEAMQKIASILPSASEFQTKLRESRDERRRQADEGNTPESAPLRDEDAALVRLLLARGADREGRDESGQTALAHAASSGKPELVRILLDAGALIDAEDEHGRTPLMLAAEECKPETVSLLLQRGANVHARTRRGGTALMAAAHGGSKRVVQILLDAGADVNARSEDGSTPLLAAAVLGIMDVVEHLRTAGAETGFLEALALGEDDGISSLMPEPGSQRTDWGRSVLAWAARAGRADIIRLLHRCGTTADTTDVGGKSPLFRAVMSGDLDTVQALLGGGASPNPPRSEMVSMSPLDWAITMGTPDMVRLLVERGANVNEMDPHGHTPLHRAAMKGNFEAARILLEAGADPNQAREEYSITPLGFAATMHNSEMVRLLLEHGANPSWSATKNVPADILPGVKENAELLGMLHAADGTDLHDAAREGDLARIAALLDAGRNIEGRDRLEHTVLHEAVKAGRADAVRLLLDRGANPSAEGLFRITPLLTALNKANVEIARMLLEAGANPNVVMELGISPLIAAARLKDETARAALVPLLLQHGAKVHIQEAAALGDLDTVRSLLDMGIRPDDANEGGVTALMTAAACASTSNVESLLHRGAAVDLTDSRGHTALTWAMTGGHIDIARILVGAGANSNGPREEQRTFLHFMTPLQAAVAHGSVEPVEFLLDNGADPNGRDSRGRSAVHSAVLLPDEKVGILKLLLERGGNPNAQDEHDSTPLATAAMMGRTKAVRTLLEHGADASVCALGGQTALQFAKSGGHMEIIWLLEQASAKSGQES